MEPGILACIIGMASCLNGGSLIFARYHPSNIHPISTTITDGKCTKVKEKVISVLDNTERFHKNAFKWVFMHKV
jgi:uncharacterized protein YlzI (FlbEa/FlbD family)